MDSTSNSEASLRFANADIDSLIANKNCKSTEYKTQHAVKLLKEFLGSLADRIEELNNIELDDTLTKFFASIRKKNGQLLKRNSIFGIRYGLARYFKRFGLEKPDIINGDNFTRSNDIFNCVLKKLKETGNGTTVHHNEISKHDLLAITQNLDPSTPTQLQLLVWFYIQLYLCKRGNENNTEMKKDSLVVRVNNAGRRYIIKTRDELLKNRRQNEVEEFGGLIFETQNERCPVALFQSYLSKLNPKNDFLWQVPKDTYVTEDQCWYQNKKYGHNQISKFMKRISAICQLSKIYTNHCLRVSFISITAEKFSENEIMAVSGHKSVSGLGIYKRIRDEKKKKCIIM